MRCHNAQEPVGASSKSSGCHSSVQMPSSVAFRCFWISFCRKSMLEDSSEALQRGRRGRAVRVAGNSSGARGSGAQTDHWRERSGARARTSGRAGDRKAPKPTGFMAEANAAPKEDGCGGRAQGHGRPPKASLETFAGRLFRSFARPRWRSHRCLLGSGLVAQRDLMPAPQRVVQPKG